MRARLAALGLAVAATAGAIVGVTVTQSAHAADPCWFEQADFNRWTNENHLDPGWGDSLSRVENYYAACPGQWKNDGMDGTWGGYPAYYRVWAQSDGDQVWIMFADRYPQTPRFTAHKSAGVVDPHTNTWKVHYTQ